MNKPNLYPVAEKFEIEGNISLLEDYGEGHINSTYIVVTDKKRYILQKINTSLFDRPDMLMKNIRLVTDYLKTSVSSMGGEEEVLAIVKTKDGNDCYCDNGDAWRMYDFVENSICYQKVETPDDFKSCAFAFGKFATYLDGFNAKLLYDVIPHFHDTPDRFLKFEKAIAEDAMGRAKSVKNEIDFFLSRKAFSSTITSLLSSGEMPTRVTHNDTKLNNILFSANTGKPLAIIDLDTIMAGSVCYDFGDSIRFGCNTAAEDEPDVSLVDFSEKLFEVYAEGYMAGFDKITKCEKDNLINGSIMMTYECGMRFLTDYLNGDTYFRTVREGQNLDRAHTQMRMVELMEKKYDKLSAIVNMFGG